MSEIAPLPPELFVPRKLVSTWAREAAQETRLDRGTHDFGIRLCVVRQDLVNGTQYLPGKPPLKLLRKHELGGMWSTSLRRFVAPSKDPIIWFCSERQEPIVLGDTRASRTLVYSAEGGGKTTMGTMWLIAEVIRLAQAGIFCAVGMTAPTHERLQLVVREMSHRIPTDTPKEPREGSLATFYSEAREFHFVTGHIAQCRSTKRQSEATGSPVQGFTWARSLDDELQDTVANGADPDIEARLRGISPTKRLATATAKDSPLWRSFRDQKLSTPDWCIERIKFDENSFEWPERWEVMRRNMSPREWQRRGLAMDVGPERQTYTQWDRDRNLRPIPLGAQDVTDQILSRWGRHRTVLAGHDPGNIVDVTTFYKAYMLPGARRHTWFVVGEYVTERTTTEQHVNGLVKFVRERFNCNQVDWRGRPSEDGDQIFVRADPYSDSGNDSRSPDKSVYTVFKNADIHILPAALTPDATKVKIARVPKDAGIEMVNNLFNSAGTPYLIVECDDRRQPKAPKFVEAAELSERNGDGEAEAGRKDQKDLSHYIVTARYALWVLERPRMKAQADREAVA